MVLFPADERYVVKLTRSKRDFDALIHFSGSNPHFPIVHKHAENQARNGDSIYHALLIERLAAARLESRAIADLVLRQDAGKHRPFGLMSSANNLRERRGRHEFPNSLADALQNLGVYAFIERLVVDLANPDNWGLRPDGTLVALDLVHSSNELGG